MLLFADAIGELDGLRAGQEVQVFYDPERPQRSVIIPGTSQDNAVRLAVAVLLVALSMVAATWN